MKECEIGSFVKMDKKVGIVEDRYWWGGSGEMATVHWYSPNYEGDPDTQDISIRFLTVLSQALVLGIVDSVIRQLTDSRFNKLFLENPGEV